MARQGIMDTGQASTKTADDQQDIEDELFFSTREAGVACFVLLDLEEGAEDS